MKQLEEIALAKANTEAVQVRFELARYKLGMLENEDSEVVMSIMEESPRMRELLKIIETRINQIKNDDKITDSKKILERYARKFLFSISNDNDAYKISEGYVSNEEYPDKGIRSLFPVCEVAGMDFKKQEFITRDILLKLRSIIS